MQPRQGTGAEQRAGPVTHPCRICNVEYEIRSLGEHYRTKHGIVIHGSGPKKGRYLPDAYITALCDGHINALKFMAAEAEQYLTGQ